MGLRSPATAARSRGCAPRWRPASGKTIVMAMVIAWQVLNKVTYPQDDRFSKNVFVVAPGLTVKSRLAVLVPRHRRTTTTNFSIVPPGTAKTSCGKGKGAACIRNWHELDWETEEQISKKRSVDKRGAKSDEAYVREVLGEMARRAEHPGHQRRGAPRLARASRSESGRRVEGRHRGGDEVGRRPGPHSPGARHSDVLRLLGDAVRARRARRAARRRCSAGSSATSA